MSITCEEVLQELSKYIDDEISPELREAVEQHLSWCRNCTVTLDGTRNVLRLICDQRAFELPEGLSKRLYGKLQRHLAAQAR
jgi:anti-sigma factor (TIGR02949 family)